MCEILLYLIYGRGMIVTTNLIIVHHFTCHHIHDKAVFGYYNIVVF